MKQTIIMPLKIKGTSYTAIHSGLPSKIFRGVDIGALQAENGWIVDREGTLEPWTLKGVVENAAGMVFYGPRVQGQPFTGDDLNPKKLNTILGYFQGILGKNRPWPGFFACTWIFLEDDAVLLLPAGLMEFIRKNSPGKLREDFWYPYNHPDKQGEDAMVFTLGILAMILLTGKHPYAPLETQEDNRNEQLRHPPLLPAELLLPGLKPEIASLINNSLENGHSRLSDWKRIMPSFLGGSVIEDLSLKEKKDI